MQRRMQQLESMVDNLMAERNAVELIQTRIEELEDTVEEGRLMLGERDQIIEELQQDNIDLAHELQFQKEKTLEQKELAVDNIIQGLVRQSAINQHRLPEPKEEACPDFLQISNEYQPDSSATLHPGRKLNGQSIFSAKSEETS